MNRTITARLCALTLAFATGLATLALAESAELRKLLETQAAQTETDLKLSAGQKAKVHPILLNGVDQRMQVFDELGISPGNPPGMLTGRKLRSKLDAIAAGLKDQLKPVLSVEQMQAYERITENGKETIKAAILGK